LLQVGLASREVAEAVMKTNT